MSRESRAARAAQSEMNLSDQRFVSLTTMKLNIEMIETAQEIGLEPEVRSHHLRVA